MRRNSPSVMPLRPTSLAADEITDRMVFDRSESLGGQLPVSVPLAGIEQSGRPEKTPHVIG